ncbi:MAG: hypothetical protein VYE04_18995 [Pseudomonadota bacterium]|nr:hypothetical protein [Pseudomonadota bacterium]
MVVEMALVASVQACLRPHFLTLLRYLADEGEPLCLSYFMDLLQQLDNAEEEADLILLCFELSKAAFLGFQYDATSMQLVDRLLEEAQQIAQTLTASSVEAQ